MLESRLAKLGARLAHSPTHVLVRLDHVASIIVNADHGIVRYQPKPYVKRLDKLRPTSI